MICLYCNKEITDPWPNQLRHKPCNRKFRADTVRAKRLLEKTNKTTKLIRGYSYDI
jgi:hypothetical protein